MEYHGIIGKDGRWMLDELAKHSFPIEHIRVNEGTYTGHTIIQTEGHDGGKGAVILHHGANYEFDMSILEEILSGAQPGDFLLVQGETNLVGPLLKKAQEEYRMVTIFNPAPYPPSVGPRWAELYPADWLVVNRMEAQEILRDVCGIEAEGEHIGSSDNLHNLQRHTGAGNLIVTMDSAGCRALIAAAEQLCYYSVPAIDLEGTIDTIGAGDAFIGFFFSALLQGPAALIPPSENPHLQEEQREEGDRILFALRLATTAAALSVGRAGAFDSIPNLQEAITLLLASPFPPPHPQH